MTENVREKRTAASVTSEGLGTSGEESRCQRVPWGSQGRGGGGWRMGFFFGAWGRFGNQTVSQFWAPNLVPKMGTCASANRYIYKVVKRLVPILGTRFGAQNWDTGWFLKRPPGHQKRNRPASAGVNFLV